jgi:hypothetical protein
MHVDFNPGNINWTNFNGVGVDDKDDACELMIGHGGGSAHYAPFSGMPYQRGAGIGSMFRSIYRFLLPLGRQAAGVISRQGMESGAKVLSSVLDGKELKESLADEGRSGLKSLLDKASQNLTKQQQQGSGGNFDFRRYRKNAAAAANDLHHGIGHITANDANVSTTGVFTQPSEFHQPESINRSYKGNKRKHQLFSIIGPPSKRKTKTTKIKHHPQELQFNKARRGHRIDALGSY